MSFISTNGNHPGRQLDGWNFPVWLNLNLIPTKPKEASITGQVPMPGACMKDSNTLDLCPARYLCQ
jgi:hypothetical protein